MTMRLILAVGLVAMLAGCGTTGTITLPQTPLEWAHFICDHEPSAYALIREVDRLSPAQDAIVREAHTKIDTACNPFPTNVAEVIDMLKRQWALMDPLQQRAQSMRAAASRR